MGRRVGRLALLALLVIVTFFYPMLAPTAHRIDQAHFDLIKDGMTKADVEAIFGVPAGRYDWATADDSEVFSLLMATNVNVVVEWERGSTALKRVSLSRIIQTSADSHEIPPPSIWLGRHGACTIHFDHVHRVTERRYFWPRTRIEPPWHHWWVALPRD